MGKILDSAKKTADLLGGISESVNNNSSNIDSLENKCDSIESDLSSRCDDLESDLQNTSDELTSQVESISVNTVKVVSNYPQTEKGTHLVMDDDGLKAVTTWDEERGYRRLIYNRDPVVYVEFSLSNYNYYDIWINGEKIKLKEGSNWFEVEELSELTWFCDDTEVPLITAIIVRTKLSQSGGPFRLFSGVYKTKYIEVKIDKQTIPSINYLFYNCPKLIWTNCKEWDTSNVTDMRSMFNGCSSLTSLDLSNFDTSKVTNMGAMFSKCKKLTSLDLSNFDTSSVTEMASMFNGCSSLTSLDLSNFDTSSVTEMASMFNGCTKLTSLDLSNFDTSSVTDMRSIFNGCSSLTSLDLSNFDTSSVTDMEYMFYGCKKLTSLDLSNFGVSKVNYMSNMFIGCSSLTSIDLSNFNISGTVNFIRMSEMFKGCSSLTSLDLSNFTWTSRVDNMSNMFYGCKKLTSLIFPGMGKPTKISSIDLSPSPLDHDSLMSIFTYDRTENSLGTLTVKLSDISKNILSEEEIASITSKGYTIA